MTVDRDRDHARDRLIGYALAAAAGGGAVWTAAIMASRGQSALAWLPAFAAVAIAAWRGALGPVTLAGVMAAAGLDYFVLGPGRLLRVDGAAQAVALGLFIATALWLGLIAERRNRQARADRGARAEAERRAATAEGLEQITAALARARTPAAVIEACVQECVHAFNADAGLLLVAPEEGDAFEIARAVGHRDPAPPADSLGIATQGLVGRAIAQRAPVLKESGSDWSPYRATIALPLARRGRIGAVLRLDFLAPTVFDEGARARLDAVAPRAAEALDRAWEYDASQRARADAETLRARADQELAERQKIEQALRASETRYRALAAHTSRLHGLTAALSEAVTVQAVTAAVITRGKVVAGATTAAVALLVEEGQEFERLEVASPRESSGLQRRFAAEPGLCASEAVRALTPVFIGSFEEWQHRYPRSASIAADGGYVSCATLPLVVEGSAIGVLEFQFTLPVNFDEEYRAVLVSVAQHCAQALDRARLYESTQRARAAAEEANRLKDDFLSIVSHELRTPLNAILGWSSMLRKGQLQATVSDRALQSIHDNATRQAKLVDELLDLSRIAAGRASFDLQEVDLRDTLRGVVESILPLAASSEVELRIGLMPPATVLADARRLEQVLFNLLGNAVKFTPPGGHVDIEAVLDVDAVDIRVRDTGVGIEPEFLPHVFDRFRQADSTSTRAYGGLGLGLAIARQLVEAQNGRISVESAGAGQGSTFRVRLPVVAPQTARPLPPPVRPVVETAAPPKLDGARVLVVDDEPDAREMMAYALERCGASVTTAQDTAEALEILDRQPLDILLADLAIPGADGYELIRRLRACGGPNAAIRAAAVTAHARDDERRRALTEGFQLHLAKPFEAEELTRLVERLLQSEAPSPTA
jgi:signal transduction histidine kinase/CheY-like chemotaxis protein